MINIHYYHIIRKKQLYFDKKEVILEKQNSQYLLVGYFFSSFQTHIDIIIIICRYNSKNFGSFRNFHQ